jgi:uncharacterized protein (TIGR02145 family)
MKVTVSFLFIILFFISCKKEKEESNGCEGSPASVTDIDGNVYNVVSIGDQCWLKEDLKVTRYNNGDTIKNKMLDADWFAAADSGQGAWCYYNNDSIYNSDYGKLYNIYAVNDARRIAPVGWRVPTNEDFKTLTEYLEGSLVAAASLREAGFNHWDSLNTAANNNSGFTAFGTGTRMSNGTFAQLKVKGNWWTSSVNSSSQPLYLTLLSNNTPVMIPFSNSRNDAFSIRCIRE